MAYQHVQLEKMLMERMVKKGYEEAIITIVPFEALDIVTASDDDGEWDTGK